MIGRKNHKTILYSQPHCGGNFASPTDATALEQKLSGISVPIGKTNSLSRVARWLQPNFSIVCVFPIHPGTIQGKEGTKFCHLATLARSRRQRWPLKSLRKVGIVGFGIERCCLHGGSGEERKIKTPNYPSELRREESEAKPRKKEVRTICLAERHQLVWPVLSGTG